MPFATDPPKLQLLHCRHMHLPNEISSFLKVPEKGCNMVQPPSHYILLPVYNSVLNELIDWHCYELNGSHQSTWMAACHSLHFSHAAMTEPQTNMCQRCRAHWSHCGILWSVERDLHDDIMMIFSRHDIGCYKLSIPLPCHPLRLRIYLNSFELPWTIFLRILQLKGWNIVCSLQFCYVYTDV